MKILRGLSLSILMVLLLTISVTYAQNPDEYNQKTHRDFEKFLGINPENYNNLGINYYNKGQYNQAISEFNKALEINPEYAEAYFNRGNAYYKKGIYMQAISDYTKAIQRNPMFTEAYKNRGNIHFGKLGDKIKGCSDWEMACDLGDCENYNFAKEERYCP